MIIYVNLYFGQCGEDRTRDLLVPNQTDYHFPTHCYIWYPGCESNTQYFSV